MDLTLLPTAVSEYNRQETGAHVTRRSAGAGYQSLTRRPGLRRPRLEDFAEGDRHNYEVQCTHLTQRKPGTSKEHQIICGNQNKPSSDAGSDQLKQNDSAGKEILESSSERSGRLDAPARERGRVEWRRHNLSSRSKSLDLRGRATSPDQDPAGVGTPAANKPGLTPQRSESLERRGTEHRDGVAAYESRVMSRIKAFNSTAGSVCGEDEVDGFCSKILGPRLRRSRQTLESAAWGQSLPSRLRPKSFSGSEIRDSAPSIGPKAGQTIWERIEKLYGPSGSSKMEESMKTKRLSAPVGDWPLLEAKAQDTLEKGERPTTDSDSSAAEWSGLLYDGKAGGTFPRRYSKGERNDSNSQPNSKTATCLPPTGAKSFANPVNPLTSVPTLPTFTEDSAPLQGKIPSRPPEEGDVQWNRTVLEMGTKSLNRGRPKSTLAVQIRSATAAEKGIGFHAHTLLEEETSAAFKDQPGSAEERPGESKNKDGEDEGRGGDMTSTTKEAIKKTERSTDAEKYRERQTYDMKREEKKKGEDEGSTTPTGDVFESSTQKITLKTMERRIVPEKVVIASAASVKNKIHQYEALTLRAQGAATGWALLPRRAFSVPTQLNRVYEGAQNSRSGRALAGLRERWAGFNEEERAHNKTGEGGSMTGGVMKSWTDEGPDEDQRPLRESNLKPASVDEVGTHIKIAAGGVDEKEGEGDTVGQNRSALGEFPWNNQEFAPIREVEDRSPRNLFIDETDFCRATSPVREASDGVDLLSLDYNDASKKSLHGPELCEVQKRSNSGTSSPVSDGDRTPTNTPHNSPFLSSHLVSEHSRAAANTGHADPTPERGTPTSITALVPPLATNHKGGNRDEALDAWVASLNQKIEGWSDDDDDDGTERDEDSNYDSDSAESSVTITSNMSQSDRRSFSVSLADLCNFGGVEYETENNFDEWSLGRRSASLSSDVSALSHVSVMPSEELDRLLEDVRGLDDSTLQTYSDVEVVVLHKEVGVGLGFSVAGGVDQNKPITVHKVFPSGVAAQEGSIQEGDQVLSINGTALSSCGHWEALRTLRRTKARGMGVVVLRRGGGGGGGGASASSMRGAGTNGQGVAQPPSAHTGQCVCVRLEKQSRDLGFSLEGGAGSSLGDRPLSVQKIFQGGPVSQVCPGDQLLEVQGKSTVGMRRLEAWTLIRGLPPGPVDVVLHRPRKPLQT